MITKRRLKELHDLLAAYRKQLLARHAENPQASPPLFLLNQVMNEMYMAALPEKRKR